jgi:beta-xylosidase
MSRRNLSILLLFFLGTALATIQAASIKDIRIRDPYIYAYQKNQTYYMYSSNSVGELGGVQVYKSKDLENWSEPSQVLTLSPTNRLTGRIWAPEMHEYKGKFYLFLTINCPYRWKRTADGDGGGFTYRSVQIFKADSPEGPFHSLSDMTTTPIDEMALDGTLYVDEKGVPYLVYCNEWIQREDGTIRMAQLAPDLSKIVSRPADLFCGSAPEWVTAYGSAEHHTYVTDGCFLFKGKKSLFLTWSSFYQGRYAIGVARSATGKITGPWIQDKKPIFSDNGGHSMIFKGFDGKLHIVFHCPNDPGGAERAVVREIVDEGDSLRIVE